MTQESDSGITPPPRPPVDPVRTVLRRVEDFKENTQPSQAYFLVMAGAAIGRRFKLTGRMTIGRAADCDICLEDEDVSRRHAQVEQDAEGRVVITDLGSTNGTYFTDGRRIERQALQAGDKIRLGPASILKFGYHDGLDENFFQRQYDSATRDGLTVFSTRKPTRNS